MRRTIKIEVEMDVDIELLARQFANLDDDSQAQFFCFAAKELRSASSSALRLQAFNIGNHLRTCECSTEDGRELIRQIQESMDYKDD